MPKRSVHDMGGNAAGPIDTHEHTPTMTERRIDAIMQLLRYKPRGYWTTDENRRTIESLTPKAYNDSGYYERWAYAMRALLVEKGILTEAEITRRLAEVKTRLGTSNAMTPKAASARRTRKAVAKVGGSASHPAAAGAKRSKTK